ncbi:MAG: DivIVA domain-containing protein [Pseudonocardiales bacterium]
MSEENNDLRDQLEWRDQPLPAVPVGTGDNSGRCLPQRVTLMWSPITGRSPGADHNVQTATRLTRAQENADPVTEEANTEASRMLDQARIHCVQLLSEAQTKAQDMVNEARVNVESMLHDAHTLERQSRDKAASLEQHATCKHAEILELNQDKSLLENTIDDLRAFELEYRTQLTLYLQSLLDKLDGPRSVAPSDPPHIQQDFVGSELGARDETGQSPPSPS